jgi:hypothetical protein
MNTQKIRLELIRDTMSQNPYWDAKAIIAKVDELTRYVLYGQPELKKTEIKVKLPDSFTKETFPSPIVRMGQAEAKTTPWSYIGRNLPDSPSNASGK